MSQSHDTVEAEVQRFTFTLYTHLAEDKALSETLEGLPPRLKGVELRLLVLAGFKALGANASARPPHIPAQAETDQSARHAPQRALANAEPAPRASSDTEQKPNSQVNLKNLLKQIQAQNP